MPRGIAHIRIYFSLCLLEGILALLLLFIIPSEAESAWILGISRSRAILIFGLLIPLTFLLALVIRSWKNQVWPETLNQKLDSFQSKHNLNFITIFLLGIGTLGGVTFTVSAFDTSNPIIQPYLIRLSPISIWFTLICAQTILFMLLRNADTWKALTKSPVWISWQIAFATLGVVSIAWFTRIFALDNYVTTDENLWATRSANFYYALSHGDFKETFQQEHPGVLTMWMGTAGFLSLFPDYKDSDVGMIGPGLYKINVQQRGFEKNDVLAAGRVFAVFTNVFSLGISFIFAWRLFGALPAITGYTLIALDPFHIAHTRLLHLDGLLSTLMTLTILAFISYLHTNKLSHLIVSGISAGLSWLTKSPGLFLIPVVFILWIPVLWREYRERKIISIAKLVNRSLWTTALWGVIGITVFFALFPAMWINPFESISKIIGAALGHASRGHGGSVFFNGEIIGDGIMGLEFSHFYPITFLWRTTPVIMFGLLVMTIGFAKKVAIFKQPSIRRKTIEMLIYSSVFTVLINFGTKKADRYLLPVYPILDLLAGLGIVTFLNWTADSGLIKASHFGTSVLLGIIIFFQAILSLQTFPYFLSYYNPVMGGSQKAQQVMMIGWGEGLDQAALYLNQKSNYDQLEVISWYNEGSFEYFFDGKSQHFPITKDPNERRLEKILNMDYVIIYIQQWQRRQPQILLEQLIDLPPEHTIWINGLEYVRIYRLWDHRE